MESPRVGITILALIACASVVGGFAGWRMRQHAGAPALGTASKDILRATYDPIH